MFLQQLRATLLGKYRNLEHDIDGLREQLDEECETKAEMQRLLSKASAETLMWRSKYESEGLAKVEEAEAARMKLACRLEEMEATVEQMNVKNANLEKIKHRALNELQEMQVAVERAQTMASAAEKKQRNFDRIMAEWKMKVDDLGGELDISQKECRRQATENYRLNAMHEEDMEAMDLLRRDNKNLSDDIRNLTDQLADGGRAFSDAEKTMKQLEAEKDELQSALEEAEAALEQEESKTARNQLELNQVKQEIEKRIQEKEDEFESTRLVLYTYIIPILTHQ